MWVVASSLHVLGMARDCLCGLRADQGSGGTVRPPVFCLFFSFPSLGTEGRGLVAMGLQRHVLAVATCLLVVNLYRPVYHTKGHFVMLRLLVDECAGKCEDVITKKSCLFILSRDKIIVNRVS